MRATPLLTGSKMRGVLSATFTFSPDTLHLKIGASTMHRIVSGSVLLLLATVQPGAACAQESAFFGGRSGIRYEQSPGVFHFVYTCVTGAEISHPAEIAAKVTGSSEEAICWPIAALRMSKSGDKPEASPMVEGRLVISRTHFLFIPNEGKNAAYYADFAPGAAHLEHKPGELTGFFGAKVDSLYKFGFENFCPSCAAGTPVPATTNLKQSDEEFGQVQASLKDFDGALKRVSELSSKMRIGVRGENQPDRGDDPESAHLYSEMNARLAGFCPEPAKSCFHAFAAYEACKSSTWEAECGARPKCSESCFLTLYDLKRLAASACVQYDQQAASLIPDWSKTVKNNSASGGPASGTPAGFLEFQLPPGPNPPPGVGCSVNASRIRARTSPAAFGVAGMEGLGGTPAGVLTTTHGMVPKDIKMVPEESGLKVGTGPNDPKKVNISAGVAVGMLLKKVVPVYPPAAKVGRIQGTVVLQASIAKTGEIEDLQVIGGPPLLQGAALDAVRQWQYRPYLFNGEPVEVETTINVIFTLGDRPPAAAPPGPPENKP
jgi:TonB family protein